MTPWAQVTVALLSNLPVLAAMALNLNSLLSPGVRLPASKLRLLLPSLVKPVGQWVADFDRGQGAAAAILDGESRWDGIADDDLSRGGLGQLNGGIDDLGGGAGARSGGDRGATGDGAFLLGLEPDLDVAGVAGFEVADLPTGCLPSTVAAGSLRT